MYQNKGKVNDVFMSKTLSWILRHGAKEKGFHITSDGYVDVNAILSYKQLRGKCTIDDIHRIVENNNKQRFTLRTNQSGNLEIKANQGHSIEGIVDLELEAVTSPSQVENVIHGTYYKCWDSIRTNGLNRMSRVHIHFASGLPSSKIISGMRRNIEIIIYVDIKKALEENLRFYKSPNGVILCPGNVDGVIGCKYFLKVCDAKTGKFNRFYL
ncbi:putative phosphotransferase [Holotrichia oblita]|uniref:Phosphotransferase n=2 Tax=Holotrichia oblita TaxID=644536 RepID=A0ACB9TAV8_HOLOL|nr:putative phosphotransferase [Holotrichia oblita]KAI4463849.1 putative phosphotransferase [Holotrichia oblita]